MCKNECEESKLYQKIEKATLIFNLIFVLILSIILQNVSFKGFLIANCIYTIVALISSIFMWRKEKDSLHNILGVTIFGFYIINMLILYILEYFIIKKLRKW
jgi:hypothetical protein